MYVMITDLLKYAQIGNQIDDLSEIDLTATYEHAIDNLKSAINKNNVVVVRDNLLIVRGNNTLFLQLFQNLIDNTIKFSDKKNLKFVFQ